MCGREGLRRTEVILLIVLSASALQLPQCVDRGWMKLKESELFTITCLDIVPTNPVVWSLVLLNGTSLLIGDCPAGQTQCHAENSNYVVSRPSPTRSEVRVIRNPGAFQDQTISCSDDNANTQFCNINVTKDTSQLAVTVAGPAYIATNGNESVTLTCVANGPVGNVHFSWNNVTCVSQAPDGSTCTFVPRPPEDDGKVVTCTADLGGSAASGGIENVSAIYVVELHYPPPKPPLISFIMQGLDLATQGNVTLTCKVTGGKPLVTSVTFTCGPSAPDDNDVIYSSNVMAESWVASNVTAAPAELPTDCTCSGLWSPRPDFYNATAFWSRTPTRYAAEITSFSLNGNSGNLVLYETNHTSVRVSCRAKGYPLPELLLKHYDNTTLKAASTNNDELAYVIPAAACEHTGVYTCVADNGVNTSDEMDQQLTVYCAPRLYPDNITTNGTEMLITELRLVVIANPAPTNITFTYHGSDGSDLGVVVAEGSFAATCEKDSVREYINKCVVRKTLCLEDGIYRVNISNALGSFEYDFEVLLPAPANITSFRLNDAEDTLAVSEQESRVINITCQAKGRPLPSLVLSQPSGTTLTSENSSHQTSYTLPGARCEHNGYYTCTADNGVGFVKEMQRLLIVYCPPRLASGNASSNVPLHVNSTGLELTLIANPTPGGVTYSYHADGKTDEETVVPRDAFETRCERDSIITYLVTCLIRRLLPVEDGLYRLNLSNSFGSLQIAFLMENAGGPAVTYFTLNNVTSESLVINESESASLELACVARGNPTPTVTLSGPDDSVLAVVESDKEVRFNMSSPKCETMGLYVCSTYNGVGIPDSVRRRLIVNCAPRPFTQTAPQSELVLLSGSGLHLRLIANPVPDRFTCDYRADAAPVYVRQAPADSLSVNCVRDRDLEYGVTCHLTSEQELESGVYNLTLYNDLGSYTLFFRVKASEMESDTGLSSSEIAGIIIGVVSFIIIVIILVVVVLRCKKG